MQTPDTHDAATMTEWCEAPECVDGERPPWCGHCGDGAHPLRPTREWRPLRNGEYPPPGPTKYGEPFERDGQIVRPILVYAEVLDA